MTERTEECEHGDRPWISMKHVWCHACERLWRADGEGYQLLAVAEDPTQGVDRAVKLDIFESRQHGWFFEPVRKLLSERGQTSDPAKTILVGDYVALNTLLTYFEAIAKFQEVMPPLSKKTGQPHWDKNGERFHKSAMDVLGSCGVTACEVTLLWEETRNPLAHEGMTYSMVTVGAVDLERERPVWAGAGGRLQIDVGALLDAEIAHFDKFVTLLRGGSDVAACSRFEKLWDYYWERS